MNAPRYEDPQAMHQAINDRLRRLPNDSPGTQLADLQRQFAYDRLLSLVFHAREDRWVLKGGTAMLGVHARLTGPPIHSTRYRDLADLTVFAHAASVDAAHLSAALTAEAPRRSLQLPTALREAPVTQRSHDVAARRL